MNFEVSAEAKIKKMPSFLWFSTSSSRNYLINVEHKIRWKRNPLVAWRFQIVKTKETRVFREIAIFLAINVGISVLLRIGQYLEPVVFRSVVVFLTVILSMLLLNGHRAFVVPFARVAYVPIIFLNISTTVLIGNSGFLTSIHTLYLVRSSLFYWETFNQNWNKLVTSPPELSAAPDRTLGCDHGRCKGLVRVFHPVVQ